MSVPLFMLCLVFREAAIGVILNNIFFIEIIGF